MKAADLRIPYGMTCTWWGRIHLTKPKRMRAGELPPEYRSVFQMPDSREITIPTCPHCGGLLGEKPTLAEWYKAVDEYAAQEHWPGYREVVEYMRSCGRCWPLDGDPPGFELVLEAFLEDKWKRNPPPDQLRCLGYFGFGGGHEIARYRSRASYCNQCPKGDACWKKHRERLAETLPAMAAEADSIAAEFQGAEYVRVWQERHECAPPEAMVMMGNMEDGMAVALGEKPKDRGPLTLPWPF